MKVCDVNLSPGSPDWLDRHGLQKVDLSLQVKVGGVVGGDKGPGSTPGHVQVLQNIYSIYLHGHFSKPEVNELARILMKVS